jgi:hypothetical protein
LSQYENDHKFCRILGFSTKDIDLSTKGKISNGTNSCPEYKKGFLKIRNT